MTETNIYGLFKNDKLFELGTRKELIKKFDTSYNVSFQYYVTAGYKFKGEYEVRILNRSDDVKEQFYGIYDLDGNCVVKGTKYEVGRVLGASSVEYLSKYAKQHKKLFRLYEVRVEQPPKVEEKKKEEYTYKQHVLHQLMQEGNSVISNKKKKDEILNYLTENGCEYTIRYVPARESLKEMWVVERC